MVGKKFPVGGLLLLIQILFFLISFIDMCVCVCVYERERERGTALLFYLFMHSSIDSCPDWGSNLQPWLCANKLSYFSMLPFLSTSRMPKSL